MRVAVIADVHGNLPALEAVLADVDRERPDLVVSGGDVAMGPMPAEVVDALRALPYELRWVRGNADRGAGPPQFEEMTRWVVDRLGEERHRFLNEAELTVQATVDKLGAVLFCHGSPRSDEEILTKVSPEERVAAAVAGIDEQMIVHGHTHVQYDRLVAGRRVICAGSVGAPYEGRRGAYWALLGPDVDLRRTEYDVEAAVAAIRATGYPGTDDHVGWLLEPPDPDETSAFFEGAA